MNAEEDEPSLPQRTPRASTTAAEKESATLLSLPSSHTGTPQSDEICYGYHVCRLTVSHDCTMIQQVIEARSRKGKGETLRVRLGSSRKKRKNRRRNSQNALRTRSCARTRGKYLAPKSTSARIERARSTTKMDGHLLTKRRNKKKKETINTSRDKDQCPEEL